LDEKSYQRSAFSFERENPGVGRVLPATPGSHRPHIILFSLFIINLSVGRASVPAAFGGTGFQPVLPHRQDAGATKNFFPDPGLKVADRNVGRALPAKQF
jgi:hypothetical protein